MGMVLGLCGPHERLKFPPQLTSCQNMSLQIPNIDIDTNLENPASTQPALPMPWPFELPQLQAIASKWISTGDYSNQGEGIQISWYRPESP